MNASNVFVGVDLVGGLSKSRYSCVCGSSSPPVKE